MLRHKSVDGGAQTSTITASVAHRYRQQRRYNDASRMPTDGSQSLSGAPVIDGTIAGNVV